MAPGWLVGGAFAYDTSVVDADLGLARLDGEGFTAGAFVTRRTGPWTLSGGLTAGQTWYDSDRSVTIGGQRFEATASPELGYAGLHARVAYDVPLGAQAGAQAGRFYLRPQASVDATRVSLDGFTEGGSPFALAVDDQSDTQLSTTLAVEAGGHADLGGGRTLRSFARLGATFYDNNSWTGSAALAAVSGTDGFEAVTELPDAVAQLNAGLELTAAENLAVSVEVEGQLGEDFAGSSVGLKATYRF